MSRPLKRSAANGLWNALAALLLAFSPSLLWCRAFLTEGHVFSVLLLCGGVSFALAVSDQLFRGWKKAVFYLAIAAAGIVLAFFGIGPVFGMVQGLRALFLQWALGQDSVIWFSGELRIFFCLVFCIVAFVQVREDAFGTCVFGFVLLCAVPLVLIQYPYLPVHPFGASEGIRMLIPGCAGLVMVLSAGSGRRAGALFAALALAAAALIPVPAGDVRDPALSKAAQRISDYARDLFYTGENRSAFSLYNSGYMPLEDRLGGSASPRSSAVMRIVSESAAPVYLRASSFDTYTGLNWQDTLSDRGYLFGSPTSAGAKDRVFGNYQIMEAEPVTVSVAMLRNDTTTLYSPQRLLSFTPESERMVLYFSRTGDLYITRELQAGDRYAVSFLPLDCDSPAVRERASSLALANDPAWNEIASAYLTVPSSVSRTVWDMTADVTWGMSDPLEMALALRDHLKENYTYTLNASAPDPEEDFVSWFLLTEQKGYCTYFASAMTVMCRMAGIPARYVTGYAAVPEEDGSCVVTDSMGHAWTEIYLKGFGWLTMDATAPGRNDLDSSGSEGSGSRERDPEGNDFSVGGEDPLVPSPAPTFAPSPDAAPAITPVPSRAPSSDSPSAAPSPSDRSLPSAAPSGPPSQPPAGKRTSAFGWIAALILVILLAALILRIRSARPDTAASRHPDKAASIYYGSVWKICAVRFGPRSPSETWIDYGKRLSELSGSDDLSHAAEDYSAMIYSREHPPDDRLARSLYDDLWKSCSVSQRLRLILFRVIGR